MKRLLLFTIILFCCMMTQAQQKLSFSVLEFEQDVFDTSAKSTEYGKKDGNGSWYAIIKVTSNNADDDITACQFNFGNMASKVEKHDETLWVYVQRNAKKVTISRPGYHTINQYDLQTTIEAGANYKMVLTSDRVQQQVVYDVKMQMVKFQTTPAVQGVVVTATNQETGERTSIGVTTSNGAVSKALNFGRYTYEVLSTDNLYYPSEGIITLNSSKDVLVENVVLRPNFADVSLMVENNAEIYLNEELKGTSKWSGRLTPGKYIVTTKLDKHKNAQQQIVITEGKGENITLKSPTPITGTIVINTNPTDAQIYLDGKDYGVTPKILSDVIIGQHNLQLAMRGYNTERREVIIEEGKVENIDVELHAGSGAAMSSSGSDIKATGIENGYEYIDLGLPSGTLWATCNIGADKPESYGIGYTWSSENDIAREQYGGFWRLPNINEIYELLNSCKMESTTKNTIKGICFTGPNGNSIFIPNGANDEVCKYMMATRGSHGDIHSINSFEIKNNKAGVGICDEGKIQRIRPVLSKIEYSTQGISNGHDYVDLGLPSGILWSTCNLGTYTSTNKGSLYAWGETTTKVYFNKKTYKYRKHPKTLPLGDDAVNALWGGKWRMPTAYEFEELFNSCTIERVSNEEERQFGWKFTGPNGNSIFLINTGEAKEEEEEKEEPTRAKLENGVVYVSFSSRKTNTDRIRTEDGWYWTSESYNSREARLALLTSTYDNGQWILDMSSTKQHETKYIGCAIRPVMTK